MAPVPPTPAQIPVPTSINSSSTSLPALTSNLLISHLRETGDLSELSSLLVDSLARTGWTDRVRALALELLRNGTCDTFPDLLEEVLRRTKASKESSTHNSLSREAKNGVSAGNKANGTASSQSNDGPTSAPGSQATSANIGGASGANGTGSIMVREGWFGPDGLPNVKIPEKTVEAGVVFLKGKITGALEPVNDAED